MSDYTHILKTKDTYKMFNFDDASDMRNYIDKQQGGEVTGTIIGIIGMFFPGVTAIAISAVSACTSILEICIGNSLEKQENFYTNLMSLLGSSKNDYDFAEVKQKMDYIMTTTGGGDILKEGWTLAGYPEISRIHSRKGGWSESV